MSVDYTADTAGVLTFCDISSVCPSGKIVSEGAPLATDLPHRLKGILSTSEVNGNTVYVEFDVRVMECVTE